MAQTNFTPISLYYTTTAAGVPLAANLVSGELAINITDGKLFYKNAGNVVTLLASSSGATGDVVGPASATDNALVRFDATTGKLIQNSVGILSDAGVLTGLTGITSSGSITAIAAATQDSVILQGRAGGTNSYGVTLTPTTLTASRTVTFANADINFSTGLGVAQGGTGLTSGTSGGVLYYSATGTLASSAALAASALVVGGGAGVAPSTITTGTGVTTALGVNIGTAGAFVVNGGALGTPSGGTVTNLTGTASININGTVGATTPTTGVFTTATAIAAATQDAVRLQGRAGGTSSYVATVTPTTLSASRTVTLPDADINFTTGLGVAQGGTGVTTLTGLVKGSGTSAFTAATAGTDYVAPGTATSFTARQTFSGSSSVLASVFTNMAEVATVSATAATGTINYDITTQSVVYYTSNASANWTVNFRASSGTSLDSAMSTGQSLTAAFLVTQGSTAYYNSAVQVDGSSVTPKWQGGTAPSAGNASSIDVYTYTIIKTGSAAFTVLASVTKFA